MQAVRERQPASSGVGGGRGGEGRLVPVEPSVLGPVQRVLPCPGVGHEHEAGAGVEEAELRRHVPRERQALVPVAAAVGGSQHGGGTASLDREPSTVRGDERDVGRCGRGSRGRGAGRGLTRAYQQGGREAGAQHQDDREAGPHPPAREPPTPRERPRRPIWHPTHHSRDSPTRLGRRRSGLSHPPCDGRNCNGPRQRPSRLQHPMSSAVSRVHLTNAGKCPSGAPTNRTKTTPRLSGDRTGATRPPRSLACPPMAAGERLLTRLPGPPSWRR